MPRALLSVYDKRNLIPFANSLVELGWDLVATGGTEAALRAEGLPVTTIGQLTGFDEFLGGRVKTLHPAIFAGILARDSGEDMSALADHGFAPINMVVCNLYPFRETATRAGVTLQETVEQIDIGGVSLLRAAAKNFLRLTVLCDPNDYTKISAELKVSGIINLATRRHLAVKAFAHTRDYDTAIHAYLSYGSTPSLLETELPENISVGLQRVETLRYGENPHQNAALYSRAGKGAGPLGGSVLGGRQLSYNNILDLDSAWRVVSSFSDPAVVIVKHLNPCGIAVADSVEAALPLAIQSDPLSAFGGVIAANRTVTDQFVSALGALFVEAIAAPGFSSTAQTELTSVRKNCRLLQTSQPYTVTDWEMRSVMNGLLVQTSDSGDPENSTLEVVTERIPTPDELSSLQFAWQAVQHVRSNAIVLAQSTTTVGIGGGLPSRVDSVRLAVQKAGIRSRGAVMASDAFFPFPDGIEEAALAGVTAVIQPGGSIRDHEVIQAANQAGIAMVFTGVRHFRH